MKWYAQVTVIIQPLCFESGGAHTWDADTLESSCFDVCKRGGNDWGIVP